ncbi:YqaJ viral recombinase family nuclease [Thermomonospora amylolytica]|uniref:YqaJ viral recombinase family nuclease n=1 Tax=Thermomonospora amylolytica TaxID=1411117 RepID=UPI000E6D1273|nr:YqaJ viral recombinase family protein [Thermomonospora amylolytica]
MSGVPYRLVLPASADRSEWLAARRRGIGSSDVPDALGVGYRSALHVYYDKRGELPADDDAGEAALWGSLDEETTAREWARRNRGAVRRVGLIARKDAPWRMCTLDRWVTVCPLDRDAGDERCALEVKHRSAWLAGKWKRQIPDDVLAQVLWQIHVTGAHHVHVACRIGGNDYRQYVVRAADHTDLIADIVAACDRLWDDIQAGRPPAVAADEVRPDQMLDLYDRLYAERTGVIHLDPTPEAAAAVVEDLLEYEHARLEEAAARARKEAAKVRLVEKLQGAEAAVLHGDVAYGWTATKRDGTPMTKTTVDLDRLAERWPDAYADVVTEKPIRRFTVEKAHRLKELPA